VLRPTDFEQRVVLQQYYDNSYTATSFSGDSVTRTLPQSIQGLADLAPKWYFERISMLTINGQSLHFTDNDVGDVGQRMQFVYSLADNLMKAYSSGSVATGLAARSAFTRISSLCCKRPMVRMPY